MATDHDDVPFNKLVLNELQLSIVDESRGCGNRGGEKKNNNNDDYHYCHSNNNNSNCILICCCCCCRWDDARKESRLNSFVNEKKKR